MGTYEIKRNGTNQEYFTIEVDSLPEISTSQAFEWCIKNKRILSECAFCEINNFGNRISGMGGYEIFFNESNFDEIEIINSSFFSSLFTCSTMKKSFISGCSFANSSFDRVDLRESFLINSDFYHACFIEADLRKCLLKGCDLSKADLSFADFRGAELKGVNLEGIKINGTIGEGNYIKNVNAGRYKIAYTAENMQIGEMNFSIPEWWDMNDKEAFEIFGEKQFWRDWREILIKTIRCDPARSDK